MFAPSPSLLTFVITPLSIRDKSSSRPLTIDTHFHFVYFFYIYLDQVYVY
jgi:hypothetical protein